MPESDVTRKELIPTNVERLSGDETLRSQIKLELDAQNRPKFASDEEVEAELGRRTGGGKKADELPSTEEAEFIEGEFVETDQEGGNASKGKETSWENRFRVAQQLDDSEAYKLAIEAAEEALRRAMDLGEIEEYRRINGAIDAMRAKLKAASAPEVANIVEIQRQLEYVLNSMNFPDLRKQRAAAQRWLGQFSSAQGVTKEMEDGVRDVLSIEPGKVSEVEMKDQTTIERIEVDIRMAMIEELAERAHANMDVAASFGSFILAQARKYGYGKTYFPKKYEDEFKKEYFARAELAAISSFWDSIAGQLSADSDPYKDMSVGKIDNCLKLSRDSYIWLTKSGKMLKYRGKDEEKPEVIPDFRFEMERAAGHLYQEIVNKRLNLWKVRGEDKIAKISEYEKTTGIDFDALILMWNLAEAECWQAKIQQTFFNHPAFRLVNPAEQRDFQSRQGWPVTGGNRLWAERRRELKGGVPAGTDIETSVYEKECIKLAKVGFESLTKFIPKLDSSGIQERDDKGKPKYVIMPDLTSGVQALEHGIYLKLLGNMVRHESFMDDFLPQTEVMTSISKGAAAWAAIEAIGSTKPKELAPEMLFKLRGKMELAFFRLKEGNSADLRMEAARQETGSFLLEWAKTFLWLPSWDNPAHIDEKTVASAADWLDLFQAVATAYNDDTEWGEFVGYGMGRINYASGLAVKSQIEAENKELRTKTRTGPTVEARSAARGFCEWFDKLEETHAGIARGKDKERKPFVTESRKKQDDVDLNKYKSVYWMTSAPMPSIMFGPDRRWWLKRS